MRSRFKITLTVLFTSLIYVQSGLCVPALKTVQQLQQPDGTTFKAKLWGDERMHGWETDEGYTVIKSPATGYWHYAQTDISALKVTTGDIVGKTKPAANLEKHQRPAKTALQRGFQASATRSFSSSAQRSTPSGASATNALPVLMINYSDTETTYDRTDFDNLLFGTGTNSMKDYYEEVSYGAFTITPGSAGVTGWYTASNPMSYYGGNDIMGYDKHPGELVLEAVAAADETIDFSEYDLDGDCYVDAVVIVHQGAGEEAGGSANTIWSHRWNLNSASYYGDGNGQYVTNDYGQCGRIVINDYVIQPETLYGGIQTIGVFAHEYGHVLGLPDLYDVDYSSSGIGNWGLMSGGAWGGVSRPGDRPVHLCAWSKYALGWIEPVQVTETLINEAIDPVSTFDDVYQFFPNRDTDRQEYYLIENRQKIGFDAGLPGSGLAIWHIDEARASQRNKDNAYECAPPDDCTDTHYRVALVQADGYWDLEAGYNRGDRGDLYPGTSGNTDFTADSYPSNQLYDGISSNVNITAISESNGVITANLAIAYTITASVTGNGQITPGDTTTVAPGEDITFTITPGNGYQISKVYVDEVSVGSVAEYTFTNTQVNHHIRAVFASLSGDDTTSQGSGSGGGSGGGCFISTVID